MIKIKTDSFTTVKLQVSFFNDANPKNYSLHNLIQYLLLDSTSKLGTKIEVYQKLASLYNLNIFANNYLYGNNYVVEYEFTFINPSLVSDDNYFKEVVEFINDVVNEARNFDDNSINRVKKIVKNDIINENEDSFNYVKDQFIELVFRPSKYGINPRGKLTDYEDIDANLVNRYYSDIFSKAKRLYIVSGNLTIGEWQLLDETFKSDEVNYNYLPFELSNGSILDKDITLSSEEGYIFHAYFTSISYDHPLFFANQLAQIILGSMTYSRLFKTFREELLLSYDVGSEYQYDKNIVYVYASVQASNAKHGSEVLKLIVSDYIKEGPTIEEIGHGKDIMVKTIENGDDWQSFQMNQAFRHAVYQTKYDKEALIDIINKITVSDVLDALSSWQLTTVVKGINNENE